MPNLPPLKLNFALLANVALLVVGAVSLVTGCVYLITGDVTLAATGLGAGLVLLFAATIERFESLKGLGLEAKTRELTAKIGEADDAVRELKQLAEISGQTLTLLASRVGRWGGSFSFEEGYSLASLVRANLQSLKCSNEAIKVSLEPWVKVTLHDFARLYIQEVDTLLLQVEQKLSLELAQVAVSVPTEDEKQKSYRARIAAISNHRQEGRLVNDWELPSSFGKLEQYIEAAPDVENDQRKDLLARLREWRSEIDYLVNHSDVREPHRWARLLQQAG